MSRFDQALAAPDQISGNRFVLVPPAVEAEPLPVRNCVKRADVVAGAKLPIFKTKPDDRLSLVVLVLVPTDGGLEQNTFCCCKFQSKCRRACENCKGLAIACQCFDFKGPAEMLAKLPSHYQPALRHQQVTLCKVHAEGPDVQAPKYRLGILPLFNQINGRHSSSAQLPSEVPSWWLQASVEAFGQKP